MQIERGDLAPGDSLPTLAELSDSWSCSVNSARGAIALLKAQGLITAGRGKAPIVRIPPGRAIRSSERHQAEKGLALRPVEERVTVGEAETNHSMSIDRQVFSSRYDQTLAGSEIGELLGIDAADLLLRRRFEASDGRTGHKLSWSTSYIPLSLVSSNPALLDESNETWAGGTQHQLLTVGIEIMCTVDQVTARMPTTVEAQMWGLPDGVPLIKCRRISIDADNRAVEISDADYPADRIELRFVIPLTPATADQLSAVRENLRLESEPATHE